MPMECRLLRTLHSQLLIFAGLLTLELTLWWVIRLIDIYTWDDIRHEFWHMLVAVVFAQQVSSLTKWCGGHGACLGGIIVDRGGFNWSTGKHPVYDEPDTSYSGYVITCYLSTQSLFSCRCWSKLLYQCNQNAVGSWFARNIGSSVVHSSRPNGSSTQHGRMHESR